MIIMNEIIENDIVIPDNEIYVVIENIFNLDEISFNKDNNENDSEEEIDDDDENNTDDDDDDINNDNNNDNNNEYNNNYNQNYNYDIENLVNQHLDDE